MSQSLESVLFEFEICFLAFDKGGHFVFGLSLVAHSVSQNTIISKIQFGQIPYFYLHVNYCRLRLLISQSIFSGSVVWDELRLSDVTS